MVERILLICISERHLDRAPAFAWAPQADPSPASLPPTQTIIVQAYLGLSLLIQPFLQLYENFHLHPSWQRFAWPSSRNPLVRPEVLSTVYMNGTQCHSRSKTLAQGTQVTLVTRPWDAQHWLRWTARGGSHWITTSFLRRVLSCLSSIFVWHILVQN